MTLCWWWCSLTVWNIGVIKRNSYYQYQRQRQECKHPYLNFFMSSYHKLKKMYIVNGLTYLPSDELTGGLLGSAKWICDLICFICLWGN